MSLKTEKEARVAARKCAKELGTGWCFKLWKNDGWKWHVTRGPVSVWPSSHGGFFALISDDPVKPDGGLVMWADDGKPSESPRQAVLKAVRAMEPVADQVIVVAAFCRNYLRQFEE